MDIPSEYQELIEELLQGTRAGVVNWTEGPDRWTFIVSFDRFSARLADSGQEAGTVFSFSVLNSEGTVIDSFDVRTFEMGFEQLMELWRDARRRVLNLDEAVNAIRDRLRDLRSARPDRPDH